MIEHAETETPEVVESESITLPRTIVGDKPVKAGDVIRVKVVAVDDENGLLNVEYADGAESKPKLGVEAMASEFDEEPVQPTT